MKSDKNPPLCTLAERIAVIELARSVGYGEAARQTGFKVDTIRHWVARAKSTTALAEAAEKVAAVLPPELVAGALAEVDGSAQVAEAVAVVELVVEPPSAEVATIAEDAAAAVPATIDRTTPWHARAPRVAGNLGALAEVALQETIDLARAGKTRQAREMATVLGITIDKAQLLAGAPTSRTESESRTLALQVTTSSSEVHAEVARLRAELRMPSARAIEVRGHDEGNDHDQ